MKNKKKAGEGESAEAKKSDIVRVTLVKGCTFTDGKNKYVSGKTYEVQPKEADRLVASGAWKQL